MNLPTSEGTREENRPDYVGLTVLGRYYVDRELGRGSMGALYLARDTGLLGRLVVIKVLLDHQSQQEWAKRKFAQERAAMALIDHPGVVGVLDTGHMPDGKPFLVMQYVAGRTLRDIIGGRPMAFDRVADIIRQIGSALTTAHELGIFHRDLKPENIMIQELEGGESVVKIVDFGVAKLRNPLLADGTRSGIIAGSFPYVAPEQVVGDAVPASDIFSLGVIAWEMLTGKAPEQFDNWFGLLSLQKKGLTKKPRDLRPEIPPAAEAVILKALSFDPNDRYARARDFAAELSATLTPAELPHSGAGTRVYVRNLEVSDSQPEAVFAHVLFMDVVGSSKLESDRQQQIVRTLQEMVRSTNEFQRARSRDEVVSLPTGDGMALVFYRRLEAPVLCAIEIARKLKQEPICQLRFGVNSGPIFELADINGNANVSGSGINRAERVMSCGSGGHILISDHVADSLSQISRWKASIHDCGECRVKDGWVRVFNLYESDFGNPEPPATSRRAQPNRVMMWGGAAAALIIVVLLLLLLRR